MQIDCTFFCFIRKTVLKISLTYFCRMGCFFLHPQILVLKGTSTLICEKAVGILLVNNILIMCYYKKREVLETHSLITFLHSDKPKNDGDR